MKQGDAGEGGVGEKMPVRPPERNIHYEKSPRRLFFEGGKIDKNIRGGGILYYGKKLL